MVLSGDAIRQRLCDGQVFKEGTWDAQSIMEVSYALRVACDGLVLEGTRYRPGKRFPKDEIVIQPGKIAILSTIERLAMPADLVGKLGIRFNYASQGLTGLMGIQVDPYFGCGHEDERLYIRVANLGNEPVPIPLGTELFTFELHQVKGDVPAPQSRRPDMWHRLQDVLGDQQNVSWTYVTSVQESVDKAEQDLIHQGKRLEEQLQSARAEIRDYLQPLVMFGIFLVAVTILGVAVSLIVAVRNTPEVYVPSWVTNWGWILLLSTLSIATIATAIMGGFTTWRLWRGKGI